MQQSRAVGGSKERGGRPTLVCSGQNAVLDPFWVPARLFFDFSMCFLRFLGFLDLWTPVGPPLLSGRLHSGSVLSSRQTFLNFSMCF